MELINKGADAVIFDKPNVLYYTMTKGKDKVKVVGDVLEAGEQFGIAFPKGSELTPKVDEALNKMFEDGTYVEIYKKWFGTEPESLPKAE